MQPTSTVEFVHDFLANDTFIYTVHILWLPINNQNFLATIIQLVDEFGYHV